MKPYFLAALLMLAVPAAHAQADGWRDKEGNLIPDTQSRRSQDGFGGWLLVTPDANYAEKWNTPAHNVPAFTEAKTVAKGQTIYVLIFFSGARRDASGAVNVRCDIEATRPDGTTSLKQVDAVCLEGIVDGPPNSMYLAVPVIGFVGEPADPAGQWRVRVALKDGLRNAALQLETGFTLE